VDNRGEALLINSFAGKLRAKDKGRGSSMTRPILAMSVIAFLAACDGNPVASPGGGGDGDGGGEEETLTVPVDIASAVRRAAYDADAGTLRIELVGLDTTPFVATYERRETLDVPGYQAFVAQEDSLDRMFIALAAESRDGSVRALTSADGGQFNRYFGGGYYEREGAFDRPAVGAGPAAGQVSYAGSYAGLLNGGGSGDDLLPPPPGTDPAVLPRQPARVAGDVFINANFSDNLVNGAVFNRVVVDNGFELRDIILLPTAITGDGTFEGDVEGASPDETDVSGQFAGVFGGRNAASVAGLVYLDDFDPDLDNEEERGVFVLRQCGLQGDSRLCDGSQPD
jgi:hypothetical protein